MLLEVRDLTVEIGPVRVVSELALGLEAGQSWGILGPNGVGKTTLLLTLAGIRPALIGQVMLDGNRLDRMPRRDVARRLGMLTQHTRYAFDATCLEIALTGRHPHMGTWSQETGADRDRALEALEAVGIAELADRSCMALSGGELRRLALATVLVQDPAVMLLDEPTNHLDPANRIRVLNRLWLHLADQGRGLIMALHDVNLATCYCSHVLMLFGDGQWEAGPVRDMLEAERLSRLYGCRIRVIEDDRQRYFALAG